MPRFCLIFFEAKNAVFSSSWLVAVEKNLERLACIYTLTLKDSIRYFNWKHFLFICLIVCRWRWHIFQNMYAVYMILCTGVCVWVIDQKYWFAFSLSLFVCHIVLIMYIYSASNNLFIYTSNMASFWCCSKMMRNLFGNFNKCPNLMNNSFVDNLLRLLNTFK